MICDPWLPIGYILKNNISIGKPLFSGDNWQIVTAEKNRLLLVKADLLTRWITIGLVNENELAEITFGTEKLYALISSEQYDLSPVEDLQKCWNFSNALAFATAIKNTRVIDKKVSLKDAIYSEEYGKLLPTFTLSENIDDTIVLGRWLSNGVDVSVNSFRRLCSLVTWLDVTSIRKIIETAGICILDENVQNEEVTDDNIQQQNTDRDYRDSVATPPALRQIGHFSLPGRPQLEDFFNDYIIDVVNNLEKYQRKGLGFPTPTILYGPPGSGKTFAVEKLASFMDWPVFYIDSSTIASSYIHDTSRKIAEVFEKAKNNAPSIIIIDEMEAYLSSRITNYGTGTHHIEEVAEFLRAVPNAPTNKVLVFGMTNMIDMLDPAAIRQGRFDHKLEVTLPTEKEVLEFLKATFKNLPIAQDVSITHIAKFLTNQPFSDAAFVIREAGRIAAKNDKSYIDLECIEQAMTSLPIKKKSDKNHKIGFI